MEMRLPETKKDQITEAVFDSFILENIINLDELAVRLGCNSYALQQLSKKTYYRKLKTSLACNNIPPEEARKVFSATIKYMVTNICVRLADFQGEFKNMTEKLNRQTADLQGWDTITEKELLDFFYPFYLEATKEAFKQY